MKLKYIPYQKDLHDEACQELERFASQAPNAVLKQFFQLMFSHPQGFSAKAEQFFQHFIHVCVDEDRDDFLCGVIAAGIKEVWLHQERVKVAYLFDLRVHEEYQRQGIGSRLSAIIEDLCIHAGARIMYLTVNGNNKKARNLYYKRGYAKASERRPTVSILHKSLSLSSAFHCETISKERGLQITKQAYADIPFTPTHLEDLFDSPSYEGTLFVEHEDSFAALSLWNASRVSSFVFERVLFPAWLWRSHVFRYLWMIALVALLCWWIRVGALMAWSFSAGNYTGSDIFWSFLYLLVWLGIFFFGPLISFVVSQILHNLAPEPGQAHTVSYLRGRVFAPVMQGPEGKNLMRTLYAYAHNQLRKRGYAMVVCNIDHDSSIRDALPPGRFTTFIMQRELVPADHHEIDHAKLHPIKIEPFDRDALHDPRDI